jgi:cell wall-associated NlpC family hydrolase
VSTVVRSQGTREAPVIVGTSRGIWSRHDLGRRLVAPVLSIVLLALLALTVSDVAQAEPAAITQAKQEAEALRRLIDDLEERLDAAIEEFNYATAMLAQTQADAAKTRLLLQQAERDLAEAEAKLAARLVEVYKQGRLSLLGVLLDAGSIAEFVEHVDRLGRVSADDAELVAEVTSYRDQKKVRAVELAEQMEQQAAYAAEVESAKTEVQQRLAANERALAGKEAQIAQLVKEEAARQAVLAAAAKKAAEEAARKARLAAQAKARARAATGTQVAVPATASTSAVVNIALQYLGCRYVWAGASPEGFDCSGFVMYVYRQVGVSLPHSSRVQAGCGVPVARADLRPGDLVFFYDPIHHAAIYIGDGKMVHAAGPGKGVRVDTVWAKTYNCARRIIP